MDKFSGFQGWDNGYIMRGYNKNAMTNLSIKCPMSNLKYKVEQCLFVCLFVCSKGSR